MREAQYECGKCGAFFSMWGPHCSMCGMKPEHVCDDCPGWPAHYELTIVDSKARHGFRDYRVMCDCGRPEGDHADWRCPDCGFIWDAINGDACGNCGREEEPEWIGSCAAVGWATP